MDQFSLHAAERRGSSALPGNGRLGLPGSKDYESWAQGFRMLRAAREQTRLHRMRRRSRRLRARLTALEARIERMPTTRPATTGS